MKNQYFGDIGDFSKFLLISALIPTGLKIGLNWYLTKDDGKTDGRHIDYLNKEEFLKSDSELCQFLKGSIEKGRRNIHEARAFPRFSQIRFFEDLLDLDEISSRTPQGRQERIHRREEWFSKSLMQLSDRDLIFCDPDNGIAARKMKPTLKTSVKHIFQNEIEDMLDAGFSLVLYNHRDRQPEAAYLEKLRNIHTKENTIETRIIRFSRYSVRDYIFLIQRDHQESVGFVLDRFLGEGKWKSQFREVPIYPEKKPKPSSQEERSL